MTRRFHWFASFIVASAFVSSSALADEPATASAQASASTAPSAPTPVTAESGLYPRIGGHLGFALPVVTIGDPVRVIGDDFVSIGLTPGITVKLSDRWSVDFEFIAMNELKYRSATTYVVDPGVVYNAGPVSAGLRVATQVGAPTNIGLVPIVVLPVAKLTEKLTYYIEGDVPMFLRQGDPGDGLKPSIGFQFQSGIAF